MKNILILEDHHIVRMGLKFLIKENFNSMNVRDVENSELCIKYLRESEIFDLLIIDLRIPGMEPTLFIQNIIAEFPHTKIIIFTAMSSEVYAKYYYTLGVRAFLNKADITNNEIVKAIDFVLSNKVYIPESLSLSLNTRLFRNEIKNNKNPFDSLSQKELTVLDLLLKGERISSISKSLNNHSSTIGTFKARIFNKLGVKNLIELKNTYDLYFQNDKALNILIN
jgi:DNA-binding NarL/FixJ family response regulator